MSAKFTNSLSNIRIASPCSANWEEMYGNERKRFCGDCKLNVYNLSGMSRREAENLILQSEGRLCVRFYRRSDGSILTRNCPVGWQAIKRKISKTASALASLIFTIFGGVGLANYFSEPETTTRLMGTMVVPNERFTTGEIAVDNSNAEFMGKPSIESYENTNRNVPVAGGISNIEDVRRNIKQNRKRYFLTK